MAKIPCIINTWVIGSLIYSFFVVTFSRYIRIFYIQKLNIFKFEFSKRQKKLFEKDERITGEVIRSNNVENDTLISINNNSTNTSSNALSGDHNFAVPVDFSIANPMNYYKGLERTIKKRITIYFVFFPILLLLTYYFVVSIRYWDKMKKACPNEPKEISSPKFVTSLVIYILSIFLIYQAFVKQKWDIKFKIEYITFLIVQICAAIFVQFIVGQKLGDEIIKYRVYFFHLYPITVHLLCVIEPLIKIFISKYTKKEEMSNVEEFLNQLSNTNFKEHVTDIAIRTFCIENLLFIEAHTDLINAVISYYKKKNPNIVESLTYCSSNVLHKSKINPILYQSFDPVFKPYYDRIYNTFIKEGGIASVNIKSITVHTIDINMENNEYSYLMFFNAIEEVSELLFINVNQKLYLNQ
ncbi:hypothetical protein BCR32DRAFT_296063 [Anaeromyces robustus]|uniref:RGS domain-containing protein n=1 Tax=Anaeromyces robustus TaxID=1754192 RepID=A0A1Y1WU94_9FUNG|nr:hypothetical protein BCR32DRAFT_296063 [Anaeromyces robustus]|eukprot:ORX76714.1 hypothetical protein BCR32DRAFT_296063 [Anaeromyces robustus]